METLENNFVKKRNSSLELLKIFAIIMIVFSHAMPVPDGRLLDNGMLASHYMDLSLATADIQRLIIVLLKYGGSLGNAIFIICSAWFLIENNKVSIPKVAYMIADSISVSVLFLSAFCVAGYDLPFKVIIKQFCPIITNANWFITCYLLFYMIHPALNLIINTLDKKWLLIVNTVLICLYCGVQFIFPNFIYYTNLTGIIVIYFIVAYLKKYLLNWGERKKLNIILLLFSITGLLCNILFTNWLGLKIEFFTNQLIRWNVFINPFIVILAICLFNIARRHEYYNKSINYISGMSMLIYIIHCNRLLSDYIRGDVFEYIYKMFSYQYEVLWVGLYAIILLLFGIIMAIVYTIVIRSKVQKVADIIMEKMKKLIEKYVNWVVKFD